MAEPDLDEDLFADLYEKDDAEPQSAPVAQPAAPAASAQPSSSGLPQSDLQAAKTEAEAGYDAGYGQGQTVTQETGIKSDPDESHVFGDNIYGDDSGYNNGYNNNNNGYNQQQNQQAYHSQAPPNDFGHTGTVGIKEDGKMFIGGLNWETTDQSLRDYFAQFGEVTECTVMRDGATGRSRGFGFLTFRDYKTVNTVMVKEHYLDGKIIDPKRAIPRDEQEKTAKIFVGGVSQDATEQQFEAYFAQFGRVIDATLMMDKDTGRPRGFGFVTFEGEAAVEACLAQPLAILDKPIEVKRAQPRGNMREEEETRGQKFNGRRGQNDRFERGGRENQGGSNMDNQQNQGGQQNGMTNGMSPQMMAQYWQRMQQYFAMMQQTMASQANMGGAGGQGMAGMANNPMMQQMMMQQMQNQGANGGGMTPQMMQQMQQMQMQQQQQQQQQQAPTQDPRMASPMPGTQGMGNGGNRQGSFPRTGSAGPGQQFNGNANGGNFNSGSPPQSWDGMYDDVPPPNAGGPGGRGRGGYQGGGSQGHGTPQPPQGQAPLNAPTGPKNLNRPGANYRGGGRGAPRGFHPYGGRGGRG